VSCNYNQVSFESNVNDSVSFNFDNSIPSIFKNKINSMFQADNLSKNINASLKDYSLRKYDVVGGSALRALEGELTLQVKLIISIDSKTINKNIIIVKRYKSNELNPFAQEEMIRNLEIEMHEDIINQIIIEVGLFEM
jgi:hypothetical protein